MILLLQAFIWYLPTIKVRHFPKFFAISAKIQINILFRKGSSASSMAFSIWFKLSRAGVLTSSISISDLGRAVKEAEFKIANKVLFVVILQSTDDFNKFKETTKTTGINNRPFLIVFTKKNGEQISDLCLEPKENYFNLKFNSKVLIKCENSPIIREWYAVYAEKILVNYYANYTKNFGLQLYSNLILYERRNSLEGINLKVVYPEQINKKIQKNFLSFWKKIKKK